MKILHFLFIAFILQTSYSDHSVWDFCKIFFKVLMGDNEYYLEISPYTLLNADVSFFIIVSVCIIMVILMLNMLIALISESHGDVMRLEKQAERYEKLHLMINSYATSKWNKVFHSKTKVHQASSSSVNYCSFLRYEENISVEVAEKIEEKKKLDDIMELLEGIKEQVKTKQV